MKPQASSHTDYGFSLLEMLFALAIMSLASLALFQSTSAMLQLSGRAVAAGERTLNTGLDRQILNNLAEGLLPAWPEEAQGQFIGAGDNFRGQSTGAPQNGAARPVSFALTLEPQTGGGLALTYQRQDDEKEGSGAEPWVLLSGLPDGSRWEYMGIDHEFHSLWPPKIRPARGYFNDDLLLTMPPLPEAIKLVGAQGATLWTGAVGRAKTLPNRTDIRRAP
jgi:prepilin-type N-terminal cleavage/methylation domain-containing protein